MLLDEGRRLCDYRFRERDNRRVIGMLLRKLVEHSGCDFVLVCQRRCVGIWKMFLVERQGGLVDGDLRLLQVGLRALHDFFHRQVGRERKVQLLSILLRAEAEIAVGAGEQIVLEPSLVFLQRGCGFLLQRREVFLWGLIEKWRHFLTHEINCALRLLNRRLGVNARRMLQIRLRLRNHARNFLHALAQIRNPFFCWRKIARDQQIKAVSQALHIDQRIPIRLLQIFGPEDLVIDVFLQDAEIDTVRAGKLRSVNGS